MTCRIVGVDSLTGLLRIEAGIPREACAKLGSERKCVTFLRNG